MTRADHRVQLFSKTAHGGATKVDVANMVLADLERSGRVPPDVMEPVQHDLELLVRVEAAVVGASAVGGVEPSGGVDDVDGGDAGADGY